MDFDAIREQRVPILWLEPEQIGVMVSGVRRQLLFLVGRYGPCSISELAKHAETYPEALYHHIRKLLSVGLVREVGVRRSGARDQVVYDARARDYKVKPQPWEPGYAEQCLQMFKSEFRIVSERHSAAVIKYGVAPEPNAFIAGRKIDCELDEEKIEALKGRLRELDQWFAEDPKGSNNKPHSVFIAVFPLDD